MMLQATQMAARRGGPEKATLPWIRVWPVHLTRGSDVQLELVVGAWRRQGGREWQRSCGGVGVCTCSRRWVGGRRKGKMGGGEWEEGVAVVGVSDSGRKWVVVDQVCGGRVDRRD